MLIFSPCRDHRSQHLRHSTWWGMQNLLPMQEVQTTPPPPLGILIQRMCGWRQRVSCLTISQVIPEVC